MPRLREVKRADADASVLPLYDALFGKDRDPVEQPGTATGTPGDWWTVFALVPTVFNHAVAGFQLYRGSSLEPRLRELGQSRAGFARGSQFVFSQHCKALRACGFSDEQIEAIPHWASTNLFTDIEFQCDDTHAFITDRINIFDAVNFTHQTFQRAHY